MNVANRWMKILILTLVAAGVISACAPLYPTPKKMEKGTATLTPFLPKSTFTPTLEKPTAILLASSDSSQPQPTSVPTEITEEVSAAVLNTPSPPPSPSQTPSPLPPTLTSSPSITPAPTNTAQPGNPVVSVSVTTNCRTGPGVNYRRIGSLFPGQVADLIARHPHLDYWYINLPGTGNSCWLWGYYANPSGNYKNLPIFTPPPSPTSSVSYTPTPTPTETQVKITHTSTPKPTNTQKPPTATPGTPPPPTATSRYSPTPTPTPTPTYTPRPPTATFTPSPTPSSKYCSYTSVISSEEQQIKSLINNARKDHGLPALQTNWSLKSIARDHGRDMTCNGLWSHTSSDGTPAWERISVALGHGPNWCYNHCCCSEIFYGGSGSLTPSQAFHWWMNHPSQDPKYDDNIHKRTILSPYSTDLGVGVIYYKKGNTVRKFYTVDFARP